MRDAGFNHNKKTFSISEWVSTERLCSSSAQY